MTLASRLQQHRVEAGFPGIEVISDVGSGPKHRENAAAMTARNPSERVARLVLVTKDRLLHFGS